MEKEVQYIKAIDKTKKSIYSLVAELASKKVIWIKLSFIKYQFRTSMKRNFNNDFYKYTLNKMVKFISTYVTGFFASLCGHLCLMP
ncbi:hypothetical protein [Candidatus Mycoplasma mahonii]|uniref:hypothetical protein n=1 Tax=Candidatus Mycoplasma mahonii TaxID=3004105 RepID=UPI0026F27B93|nr:hypothetical protein [Candidatus Mycoplasma mahonii]WKX02630.1 hypothetical protein O3I44_00945 [Candidatus Mycoplasma mahonii]